MSADNPVPVQEAAAGPGTSRSGLWRMLAAFAVLLAGSVVLDGWLTSSTLVWLAWLVVGAIAGYVAGRASAVWLVPVATLLVYPLAMAFGRTVRPAQPEPMFWAVLVIVGGMVMAGGFGIGSMIAERRARWISGIAVAVAVLGFVVWVGFSGYMGSDEMIRARGWNRCDTPMSMYGWTYEAINYDIADDARLAGEPGGLAKCTSQGETAGSDVVTDDGIPIAGWYIPAGNGAGPTAPTIIAAPGWKSNKSEIVQKYAPFFHDRFNLLLLDLRNQGRSGGDTTTWGHREKLDIKAMVDWLERTKQPTWIGAQGNSMGASTVLAAAVDDQRIRALVLDSMHADVTDTFTDGVANERNLPGLPTAWAVVNLSNLRSGVDIPSVNPVRMIGQVGDRPVLLLHGTNDVLDTPDHAFKPNLAAAEAAGIPVTTHECEGAGHGGLWETCSDAWQSWLDEFLATVPDLP
jgi:pimeloyl-ACP methyl ester carboxylesterase